MKKSFTVLCAFVFFPFFASAKSVSTGSDEWSPATTVVVQDSASQSHETTARPRAATTVHAIPIPAGLYVLDDPSNEKPASGDYSAGLMSSTAYLNDVAGAAIFVPVAKILPSISTWGQFNWTWSYVDSLVDSALSHGKKFSIELEMGFQSSTTYLQAWPSGFLTAVGDSGAPLFDVWVTGGSGGRGISAYIPLPWVPKVQQFWSAAASALAAHLQLTGAYASLTLVHFPGLSVYDEELRLPTGYPAPTTTDTTLCPDGRPAYPTVLTDADTSRWRALGYSDTAVVNGFGVIASAFAQAFPDRYLGLSLFPLGATGIDFPNLTGDTIGTVASEIAQKVNSIAPGRVLIQSDNLDANQILPEVKTLAARFGDEVGWQSNKHGGTGAGCNGGGATSCDPDGPTGPYFYLLQNGWQNSGKYLEVWSYDVVNYPQSIAAAVAAGYYTATSVQESRPETPAGFELEPNFPNPFNPSTTITFSVARKSNVKITVYDELGRLVTTLVNGEMDAGSHHTVWDGRDNQGEGVASGVYYCRMEVIGQAGGRVASVQKLVLVK